MSSLEMSPVSPVRAPLGKQGKHRFWQVAPAPAAAAAALKAGIASPHAGKDYSIAAIRARRLELRNPWPDAARGAPAPSIWGPPAPPPLPAAHGKAPPPAADAADLLAGGPMREMWAEHPVGAAQPHSRDEDALATKQADVSAPSGARPSGLLAGRGEEGRGKGTTGGGERERGSSFASDTISTVAGSREIPKRPHAGDGLGSGGCSKAIPSALPSSAARAPPRERAGGGGGNKKSLELRAAPTFRHTSLDMGRTRRCVRIRLWPLALLSHPPSFLTRPPFSLALFSHSTRVALRPLSCIAALC